MKLIRVMFAKNVLLFLAIFTEIIIINIVNYVIKPVGDAYWRIFFINCYQRYLLIAFISLIIGKIITLGIEFLQKVTNKELPKIIIFFIEYLPSLVIAFIILTFKGGLL